MSSGFWCQVSGFKGSGLARLCSVEGLPAYQRGGFTLSPSHPLTFFPLPPTSYLSPLSSLPCEILRRIRAKRISPGCSLSFALCALYPLIPNPRSLRIFLLSHIFAFLPSDSGVRRFSYCCVHKHVSFGSSGGNNAGNTDQKSPRPCQQIHCFPPIYPTIDGCEYDISIG